MIVSIHAPRRGRYSAESAALRNIAVSIHAPRRGRYAEIGKMNRAQGVSIHAPRRGRYSRFIGARIEPKFQSTPPVGGDTLRRYHRE